MTVSNKDDEFIERGNFGERSTTTGGGMYQLPC